MPYQDLTIAQWLINKSVIEEHLITNLHLHKLNYFAHGFYYKIISKTKQLIQNDFEARKFGPVNANVYEKYKHYKNKPIKEKEPTIEDITEADLDYLNDFWEGFARHHEVWELVGLSHIKEGAWCKARDRGLVIIPQEYIQQYFISL